jgi:hypothetical protein
MTPLLFFLTVLYSTRPKCARNMEQTTWSTSAATAVLSPSSSASVGAHYNCRYI